MGEWLYNIRSCFQLVLRSLNDWEIAWDVVSYPVAYSTTNLLSQGAGRRINCLFPFVLLPNSLGSGCSVAHLLTLSGQQPSPQNMPSWVAAILSSFQLDTENQDHLIVAVAPCAFTTIMFAICHQAKSILVPSATADSSGGVQNSGYYHALIWGYSWFTLT